MFKQVYAELDKLKNEHRKETKRQKEKFDNLKKTSDDIIAKLTESNKLLCEQNVQMKRKLQQYEDQNCILDLQIPDAISNSADLNDVSTNNLNLEHKGEESDPKEGCMTIDPKDISTNNPNPSVKDEVNFEQCEPGEDRTTTDPIDDSTNSLNNRYKGKLVKVFHPDYYYINHVHTDNVKPLGPVMPLKSILKSKIPWNDNSTGTLVGLTDNQTCHICAKRFTTAANMMRHVREHWGRRFSCEYENCDAKFTQNSSLKVHILGHKGIYPYQCEICGRRFLQSKTLVCHSRTHTGERPFVCDYCGDGFAQKSNLVRHFKVIGNGARCLQRGLTVRNSKRYKCNKCPKTLASKQSLMRHNKVTHASDADKSNKIDENELD